MNSPTPYQMPTAPTVYILMAPTREYIATYSTLAAAEAAANIAYGRKADWCVIQSWVRE
jgi:hypothetical protein